jgi:hypothetical protein
LKNKYPNITNKDLHDFLTEWAKEQNNGTLVLTTPNINKLEKTNIWHNSTFNVLYDRSAAFLYEYHQFTIVFGA